MTSLLPFAYSESRGYYYLTRGVAEAGNTIMGNSERPEKFLSQLAAKTANITREKEAESKRDLRKQPAARSLYQPISHWVKVGFG